MLQSLLIFLFYTAIFLFILYRCTKQKSFVLNFKETSFIFLIKIIAGCFYGYFFLHYYGGDDTWMYHNESLKEYALLKADPIHFFINDIFTHGYTTNQFKTIFNSSDSFAKNLEYTILIKLLAIFDLFSGGRYYVNVIFYDVIVFWGCYYLFKTFVLKYPEKRFFWLTFIFCLPPLLFWTSGLRKDGICFAIICGLIYQLYFLFERKISAKHVAFAMLLFTILFLLRNYIALVFIPLFIAYAISKKFAAKTWLVYLIVFAITIAGFFITAFISDSYNLPQKMADRQQSFLELKGNSYLPIDTLNGNFNSYVKVLPQALDHVFIRPYPLEAKGILYIFSFLDVVFFFLVFVRIIFKSGTNFKRLINDPFVLSLITIALFNYVIIGYTVPFLGAIVRYKASFEIFFILIFIVLQKTKINPLFKFRQL